MRWRDIKYEPMAEADGNHRRQVLQQLEDGTVDVYPWDSVLHVVAWMPIRELPKFVPSPDPPEGWRLVIAGEPFDRRAKILIGNERWETTGNYTCYADAGTYIVPIDPTYRPFADAAEFLQFRSLWWRHKAQKLNDQNPPAQFSDEFHGQVTWRQSLATKVFCNGTPEGLPFGVKE